MPQSAPARLVRLDIGLGTVIEGHGPRRLEASRILGLAPLLKRIDAGEELAPQRERAFSGLGQAHQLDWAQPHAPRSAVDAVAEDPAPAPARADLEIETAPIGVPPAPPLGLDAGNG